MKREENFLLKRPVGRLNVAANRDERCLVIKSNHRLSKWAARFLKKPAQTYLHLDEEGAFVWSHCNGEYTVGEIVDQMRTEFGPEAEPVLERLIVFLRILLGKELIDFHD
jgi:hypothetical protein